MLIEQTLYGEIDKVKTAIERLKTFEPEEGYWLADSGGKDSCVILALAKMSGVKFEAHHNLTTIDPPELVRFVMEQHKETIIDRPDIPFLKMLPVRGFPQRQSRWWCAVYKEGGGAGRRVITGIRWGESTKRAGRRMVEVCMTDKTKAFIHPIIDWLDEDVWEFIRTRNIPYCKLYDEGNKRIGCLFCPMASRQRLKDHDRYPRFVKLYIRAFEQLYADRLAKGSESIKRWKSGKEMFYWWLKEDRTGIDNPDQTVMFE